MVTRHHMFLFSCSAGDQITGFILKVKSSDIRY